MIITRFGNNEYEIYEPIENIHEDQILKYSSIPADISENIFKQSKNWAMDIAEELKFIGTLCVEFFIDRNENLFVNEIALEYIILVISLSTLTMLANLKIM